MSKRAGRAMARLIAGVKDGESPFEEKEKAPPPVFIVKPEDVQIQKGDKKYSAALVQTVCTLIVRGLGRKRAAIMAGIHETTFYDWLNQRPDFLWQIEQAETLWQASILEKVDAQIEDNWAAGMTRLERAFPNEFGRKDRVEHTVTGSIGLNMQKVLISPESIAAASALEAAMQQQEAIEGEVIRELPEHLEDGNDE